LHGKFSLELHKHTQCTIQPVEGKLDDQRRTNSVSCERALRLILVTSQNLFTRSIFYTEFFFFLQHVVASSALGSRVCRTTGCTNLQSMPAESSAVGPRGRLLADHQFTPSPTNTSFRDLLIFEERLKQNAERMKKRKHKYQSTCSLYRLTQVFLLSLSTFVLYMAYVVWTSSHEVCAILILYSYGKNMANASVSLLAHCPLLFTGWSFIDRMHYAFSFFC